MYLAYYSCISFILGYLLYESTWKPCFYYGEMPVEADAKKIVDLYMDETLTYREKEMRLGPLGLGTDVTAGVKRVVATSFYIYCAMVVFTLILILVNCVLPVKEYTQIEGLLGCCGCCITCPATIIVIVLLMVTVYSDSVEYCTKIVWFYGEPGDAYYFYQKPLKD